MNSLAHNRTVCFIALVATVMFSLGTCSGYLFAADVTEVVEEEVVVEENSLTVGNEVTTTETVTVTTIPNKYDLSKRWYFGGGFNYNFENFANELSEVDWDNTWGLDIKAGYFFTDYFALEFMFQYLNEFKSDNSGREYTYIYPYWYYYDWDEEATVTGYNFSFNGKGFIPLDSIFRPYGVLGLGYAHGELEDKIVGHFSDGDYTLYDYSEKESGMCGRFGAGLDVFFSKQFALEGEVSYFMGFGDVDNVRYTTLALNALVLFQQKKANHSLQQS